MSELDAIGDALNRNYTEGAGDPDLPRGAVGTGRLQGTTGE
jgi:hypothetical protein